MLEHSPAKILHGYLVAQGWFDSPRGTTQDPWPLFANRTPATPGKAAAVHNTEPVAQHTDLATGARTNFWGVQLQVRAEKEGSDDAFTKINAAVRHLTGIGEVAVVFPTARYILHQVMVDSGPMDAGREPETERPIYTANLLLHLSIVT